MSTTGLIDLGYKYVVLDDCWAKGRDSNGILFPDPVTFPSGIPALSAYAKSKGAKLGIYTDIGKETCAGRPGSYGHFEEDIHTFFSWGVEYVKVDYCHKTWDEIYEPAVYYQNISNAIQKFGGQMVFSMCEWGWEDPWTWAESMANQWRITLDIYPQWMRVLEILDTNTQLSQYAGPGHWNDPDMVEVGVNGTLFNDPSLPATWLTEEQSKSHFSLWSIFASPLILGNDIRNMPDWVYSIISAKSVLAVNQDPLGKQATLLTEQKKGRMIGGYCLFGSCVHTQVFNKTMVDNNFAILLFNRAHIFEQDKGHFHEEDISVTWASLGLHEEQSVQVTDLWSEKIVGVYTRKYVGKSIPANGVQFLQFKLI
eukprot:TRINITY_DN4827_c0_g1_i2.p1 TRINITY_DN4827_c0_g1~~TRINITY_DN4827_c0_g1_i2.p1  ORF type:complete len:418 (-),score=62.03 TRINITY_DN4827_c0_g1_i2:19-1122(-)